MLHIEKNGTKWLVSKDVGGTARTALRFFNQRGEAMSFLRQQRADANREVERKMDELEKAQQFFDMVDKSLEAEAP